MLGLIIGSTAGSYIPVLWGDQSFFSVGSIIWSTIGGLAGVWAGYKMYRNFS